MAPAVDDLLLTAEQASAEAALSKAAFWRAVAQGLLPPALYPMPRAPRWYRSELRAAIEATRSLPRDQFARRRAAKIAAAAPPATLRCRGPRTTKASVLSEVGMTSSTAD